MSQKKPIPPGYHIHPNGGGLVADTAHVDDSAYIGVNAQVYGDVHVYGNAYVFGKAHVFGNAHVYDNAQVFSDAHVYGNAHVYGDVHVYGNAHVSGDARVSGGMWTSSPLYIQGSRHPLTNSRHGYIAIGCHEHTFAYWLEHHKGIGRAEKYSEEEIEEYGLLIELFSKIGK
jgi:hypothetical protein